MSDADRDEALARLGKRYERERKARLSAEMIAEEATRHALHDPLTGLPNRRLFIDRLNFALERCDDGRCPIAVLFLDLDRFKVINDSLGHSLGDQLLIEVAGRIQRVLRPGDTLARFGGDEFTVLCPNTPDPATALAVGDRINLALAAPIVVAGREIFVTSTIGAVLASDRRKSAHDLIRDADTAMYTAKAGGGSRCAIFDETMHDGALERLQLENGLRVALARGEFRTFFQPIYELEGPEIVGLEALVRWQHPERGLVPPLEFIPVSEETGLIAAIGQQVLEDACTQMVRWSRHCDRLSILCVNLSVRQLDDPDFVGNVARTLVTSGLDPALLRLEITESVLVSDADQVFSNLEALRGLGVRLAMDDFGAGHSSLSYLKRFRFDLLKIDRSFVDGVGTDDEDTAIVGAIVAMARALGLTAVAEGVETAGQAAALVDLGCEFAQGFYLARPMPAEQIDDLLHLPRRVSSRAAA